MHSRDEHQPEEISIKDVASKVKAAFRHLRSKTPQIIIITIIGGVFGLLYSFYKKPLYTADSTFVLDQSSKMNGMGQYAGLASLAGIDIAGGGGQSIFQSDNIIELYKSRLMISQTLLSKVNIGQKPELLIERYIQFNGLRDKWKEDKQLANLSFSGDPGKFSRKQDSVLLEIIKSLNAKNLSVSKLDKKLSIIIVSVKTNDELFSKEFNVKLVETVNKFYTQTSIKKSYQNVSILKKQADSLRLALDRSLSGVASAIDAAPNANPGMVSLKVPSQKRQIDVQANSAIYGEVVKNLELAKMSLRQDAPLIQIIDQPVLPLDVTKIGKLKGLIIGLFIGLLISVVLVVLTKILKQISS